jgi:hypothetical protein
MREIVNNVPIPGYALAILTALPMLITWLLLFLSRGRLMAADRT